MPRRYHGRTVANGVSRGEKERDGKRDGGGETHEVEGAEGEPERYTFSRSVR